MKSTSKTCIIPSVIITNMSDQIILPMHISDQALVGHTSTTFHLPIIAVHINNVLTPCLLDTGSARSLMSATTYFGPAERIPVGPCDIEFCAVNGSPITSYGCTNVMVHLLNKDFTVNMYVADISGTLLGNDFLSRHKISFNVDQEKVTLFQNLGCTNLWSSAKNAGKYQNAIKVAHTTPTKAELQLSKANAKEKLA